MSTSIVLPGRDIGDGQERSAQIISRLIPASYFITMVRGVFLKGLGFGHFAFDLATLGTFAAVVYGIAILGFRKRAG
jgi:ABC-2 type transport system permease protein